MTTQIEIDYALMAGHAYRTTRAEINWIPNVRLDLPSFPTSAINSLRDYVGAQLSPADQRGWALSGPSSIVIAIAPGTNAAGKWRCAI